MDFIEIRYDASQMHCNLEVSFIDICKFSTTNCNSIVSNFAFIVILDCNNVILSRLFLKLAFLATFAFIVTCVR